jgi:ribonuclease E
MTFTEAAVEVLRRAGRPLHYTEIAELALRENLLSHVGQDPEVTMGQRLAAMAKRDEERKVLAVAPEGTFALIEWNVSTEEVVEAVAPPLHPAEDPAEPLYRPREREPRPIHAQARRRMEALQSGVSEEPEEKRERKKFPPPAEVVFEWLAQRQSGAPLAELADALFKKGLVSDALVRDPHSLVQALLEDNRRRTEAGRKPAFIVDGDRCTLVEFPPAAAVAEEARTPHTPLGRPMSAAQLVAEGKRAVVRALRRRLADLETGGFEQVCALLLDRMGMRDVRVAKRSKEGPLYLSRQRRGVSDLRTAVKLVRGGREIGRSDVQELRKDLAHYSAQFGLVLAPGEAGRDARAEASAAAQAPVALYAGDALAEELIALRVGVTVQVVEIADVDEALFASVARPSAAHERREKRTDERKPQHEPGEALGEPQEAKERLASDEPREVGEREEPQPEAAQPAEPQPSEPAAPPESPAEPQEPQPPAEAGRAQPAAEERDSRRRRRGRDDAPTRATSAAEQAWGQPIGTPRKVLAPLPDAPPVEAGAAESSAEAGAPEPAGQGGAPETERSSDES